MDPVKSEDGDWFRCPGCLQWVHWRLYTSKFPHREPKGRCAGCRRKSAKKGWDAKQKAENQAWIQAHQQGNS